MTSEDEGRKKLEKLLNELAKRKGIELPRIRDTDGRKAYLRFLQTRGYQETELLPVFERKRLTPEMLGATLVALIKAVDSDDQNFVKSVVWMTYNAVIGRDNTNLIVDQLASSLVTDLVGESISVPAFYAGVFPTDSFNAQCCIFDDQNLVLLDTGCMEMATAITISFLSNASQEQKVLEIANVIDNYVLSGKRADPYASTAEGIDWGGGLVSVVVNSFENYMIGHELGHLALGHARANHVRHHSPRIGKFLDLVDKSEPQEFQADLWACRALIQIARKVHRTDSDLSIAIAGPSLGLGVALLVEGACKHHGRELADGHPPAAERLYMVQLAYELLGVQEEAFISRRFLELVGELLNERYPATQLPPFLDRTLNRKLVPVLDHLGIDYSNAPYITEVS